MSELLLAALLHQALLYSAVIVLLWTLRPMLLKRLGAGAAYAAWLALPALLSTPLLPRPAQEPLRVVLQAAGGTASASLPALPTPPASHASVWLALWTAGTLGVLALQAYRQWQLARLGVCLPAGSSPALVGLLRPRLALPTDFERRFSPAERELVLAHENVHRRRQDNLWNLVASALTALHWWNPLAWWALRRFRADQELACDAAVLVKRPGEQATYTRALLAAHGLAAHAAPLASRWGTTHPLVERIAMLNHPRPLNRRRALLLAASVSAVSALAYAAESPPQPASSDYLKLKVVVEQVQGNTKTSRTVSLIGRDGERLLVIHKPDDRADALRLGLVARKVGADQVMVSSELSRGEPPVELGRPRVLTHWDQKARIEFSDPITGAKLALEFTPTALPADYQPPMPSQAPRHP